MNENVDIDQLKKRNICFNCIEEGFLKNQVSKKGRRRKCSYCTRIVKCYSVEELSELVETAFKEHYHRTWDQPTSFESAMLADKEFNYDWERHGEEVVPAITNAAEIPEAATCDIQKILEAKFSDFEADAMGEETEFSTDSYYEESGINDAQWQDEWREFEHSLKTETRFFSQSASALLKSVFAGIDTMQTRDGRSLIVDAGPGTKFSTIFRARSFQLDEKLQLALARPDEHLGSPPPADAQAGRMNAHGISVFYGANSPMVALAEVRPPVGSQVALARFDIIRPLRLLDLTALNAVATTGSLFDPSFIDILEQTMFLRNLSRRITIPVMPDHERFEYLATQVIADFLSTEYGSPLDGIIFPSVQGTDGALNFVLLHKAARVEKIELPKGTEVSVDLSRRDDEGWHREYTVIEEVPPKKKEAKKALLRYFGDNWTPPNTDPRPLTLKIDQDSVCIHIVDSIQFRTTPHKVSRYRWKQTDPPF